MDIQLTRDQKLLIGIIHKQYLACLEEGNPSPEARYFRYNQVRSMPEFKDWNDGKLVKALNELDKYYLIELHANHDFILEFITIYCVQNNLFSRFFDTTE